jgi:hypothetical protein
MGDFEDNFHAATTLMQPLQHGEVVRLLRTQLGLELLGQLG